MVTIDDNELRQLKEAYTMLGQISFHVENFCGSGDWTTVDAVKRMKAELQEAKAKITMLELDKKYQRRSMIDE